MTGRDFLAAAAVYLNFGTDASDRSAVSRAYYGLYHVARQRLDDAGFRAPRSDYTHAYVSRRLSAGGPACLAAARFLNDLRGHRNRADYDLNQRIAPSDARKFVRHAGDAIAVLDALTAAAAWVAAVDAIKVYERDILREVTWRP